MKRTLRLISVRQPWAWLVCRGIKKIENRNWTTDYRGPVLVQAPLGNRRINAWHDLSPDEIEAKYPGIAVPRELPRGGIVGIVGLCDVVTRSADQFFEGPFGLVVDGASELPFLEWPGHPRFPEAGDALLKALDRHCTWGEELRFAQGAVDCYRTQRQPHLPGL